MTPPKLLGLSKKRLRYFGEEPKPETPGPYPENHMFSDWTWARYHNLVSGAMIDFDEQSDETKHVALGARVRPHPVANKHL